MSKQIINDFVHALDQAGLMLVSSSMSVVDNDPDVIIIEHATVARSGYCCITCGIMTPLRFLKETPLGFGCMPCLLKELAERVRCIENDGDAAELAKAIE